MSVGLFSTEIYADWVTTTFFSVLLPMYEFSGRIGEGEDTPN